MPPVQILGIETSCDETAAAVIEDARRILSNVVLSQVPVHRLYGGVVPELASREHLRGIVPVVRQALEQAGLSIAQVDAVAVTRGPGLVGALLVGITYAKALAMAAAKPLIGVNHLEGHVHAVMLEERRAGRPDPEWPAVALIVSGGHTQLYRVERRGDGSYEYQALGQTRDDAAGEAYDKVAKLLALGYPGGPVLDKLADFGDPDAVRLGPIRLKGNSLDFSFSGIKTAVLRHLRQSGMEPAIEERRRNLAELGRAPGLDDWKRLCDQPTLDLIASFQATVVGDLAQRAWRAVDQAAEKGRPVPSLLVTGGVAANRGLRRLLQSEAERRGVRLYAPAPALCTDNAAMIATAAFPHFERRAWAGPDLAATAQLPLAQQPLQ